MSDVSPEITSAAAKSRHQARLADLLASTRFAIAVVLLLIVACIVGTVLPQDGQVQQYLNKYPDKAGRMAVLSAMGLTHVFSAWWFIALLCTLAASLVACSQRRFKAILRATGSLRGRAAASLILHSSILLILAGGVIRAVWGEKGHIQFHEGQTVSEYMSEKGPKPLPYSIRLEKFEIETYSAESNPAAKESGSPEDKWGVVMVRWPEREVVDRFPAEPDTERVLRPGGEPESSTNVVRIRVARYVPDFVMDTATRQIKTRSSIPRNPAIQVLVEGAAGSGASWLFARHPEFNMRMGGGHGESAAAVDLFYQRADSAPASAPIKSFRSTVAIIENGQPAPLIRRLEVNSPLSHKGYTFYQSGYNEQDPTWTSLQVVRDPGVIVVYAGFALTMIGMVMLFCLYPQGMLAKQAGPGSENRKTAAGTSGDATGDTHDTCIQS